MSRSIRSSLFLLVAPFALTFTLVAWVISTKIGPWLSQPLVSNCAETGYPAWFCNLQAGLMPWIFLGIGILILLTVTATLSLGLFRAHLKDLQQDVMDFQKGHRNQLAANAPREMSPLVKLLNRILQAGAEQHTDVPVSRRPVPPAPVRENRSASQERRTPERYPEQPTRYPEQSDIPPEPIWPPATETTPRPTAPEPAPPRPRREPETPPAPPPASTPEPYSADLEVSLEELDADIEKAMNEPVPEPEPEVKPEPAPRPAAKASPSPERQNRPAETDGDARPASAPGKKNLAFPTRKCRKLIAMFGYRYPDVNFELITDVDESKPWTIREAELTEIFGQLLDNAGRWAESQVNIFLAIKGNMLVFGVADDGPGLDPAITTHLGEEGFQVSADQPAGSGLVTVRQVIDAHGGSLAFDRSRLGGLEAIAAIPGSPLPRHVSSKGAYH